MLCMPPEPVEGRASKHPLAEQAERRPAVELIHMTGIPPTEIRSEQDHGRSPSIDWRHV
jgi:hypothetical protein